MDTCAWVSALHFQTDRLQETGVPVDGRRTGYLAGRARYAERSGKAGRADLSRTKEIRGSVYGEEHPPDLRHSEGGLHQCMNCVGDDSSKKEGVNCIVASATLLFTPFFFCLNFDYSLSKLNKHILLQITI